MSKKFEICTVVTMINGILYLNYQRKIYVPNAINRQWTADRLGKLLDNIDNVVNNTVDAAEMVDSHDR